MLQQSLNYLTTTISLTFLVVTSSPICYADSTFEITSTTENVWYWPNLESGWRRAKPGQKVNVGALFQSTGACSIVFLRNVGTDVQSEFTFDSNSQTMFRLTNQIERKMVFTDSFKKNQLPALFSSDKKDPEKIDITEAWRMLVNPTTNADRKLKSLDEKKDDKNKTISRSDSLSTSVPIIFTYPPRGGSFFINEKNAFIPIIWKSSEKHLLPYEILVKYPDAKNFRSVGNKVEPRFDLKVFSSGPYAVRIQDKKSSAQSPELIFNVFIE